MSRLNEVQPVFGPVPSRRLGRSLGINNIPPKTCTYTCTYCQLGRTLRMSAHRGSFREPAQVVDAVVSRAASLRETGQAVDYLTFVPDGEPTLDEHLGREIRELRSLGIAIAVITNASLLWQEQVRADLAQADWVSLKVDAVQPGVWRAIDRPHRKLSLETILEGVLLFSRQYERTLVTETMLVDGGNDADGQLEELAVFLAELSPRTAYLSIPTRPPACRSVRPPDESTVNRAFQTVSDRVPAVECLLGYEGNAFASTGDAARDLLSITAVHPMRRDAVEELLEKDRADWSTVSRLVEEGMLVQTRYRGQTYTVRRLGR